MKKIEREHEDYLEVRSCKMKKSFFSRAEAKRIARKMSLRGTGRLRAYKCKFCPNYHIGHNNYA